MSAATPTACCAPSAITGARRLATSGSASRTSFSMLAFSITAFVTRVATACCTSGLSTSGSTVATHWSVSSSVLWIHTLTTESGTSRQPEHHQDARRGFDATGGGDRGDPSADARVGRSTWCRRRTTSTIRCCSWGPLPWLAVIVAHREPLRIVGVVSRVARRTQIAALSTAAAVITRPSRYAHNRIARAAPMAPYVSVLLSKTCAIHNTVITWSACTPIANRSAPGASSCQVSARRGRYHDATQPHTERDRGRECVGEQPHDDALRCAGARRSMRSRCRSW